MLVYLKMRPELDGAQGKPGETNFEERSDNRKDDNREYGDNAARIERQSPWLVTEMRRLSLKGPGSSYQLHAFMADTTGFMVASGSSRGRKTDDKER